MLLSPAELLGLPPDLARADLGTAILRYALLAAIGSWCLALASGRRRVALLVGVLTVGAATGYWVLALARPWGVLVDPGATRRAAELAVATFAPGTGGAVVGEAPGAPIGRGLLASGLPPALVQLLPTLMPALALPALGLAVALGWADRDRAAVGASLVLVAATGELGAAAGWGHLPGIWSHPASAAVLPFLIGAALVLARLGGRLGSLGAPAVLLSLALLPAGGRPAPLDALLALTLEQGLWLPLAWLGLREDADAGARSLVGGGAALLGLAALGAPLDAWAALVVYRVGLILAATCFLWRIAPAAGTALKEALPRLTRRFEARWITAALALAIAAPASAVTWWLPLATDPVAAQSLDPLSPALEPALAWVRENTPPDAVFLASPAYSPTLAVRAGRRVLRATDLVAAGDDAERVVGERRLLRGRRPPPAVQRYGVGWVFIAPGDFRARGVGSPEQLLGRPGLALRYRDEHRFYVFQVGEPARDR